MAAENNWRRAISHPSSQVVPVETGETGACDVGGCSSSLLVPGSFTDGRVLAGGRRRALAARLTVCTQETCKSLSTEQDLGSSTVAAGPPAYRGRY